MTDELPPSPPQPEPTEPPPPKKKRRRRWPWVILAVIFLLFLLVLIAPTFVSIGIGKSIVLSQVNSRLNGHLQIESWSLGWFSPIRIDGLRIEDSDKRQVLQLPKLTTGLTLLDAIRGKYNL